MIRLIPLISLFATHLVTAQPKNLVFILADDLGWGELGCYGQEKIRTPHIDRLAAEGMRFTSHYSGAPVCAPSRGVLMTGKHLGHAEIRGNRQAKVNFPQFEEGQHPISAEALTIASVFQKAGFATAAIGKWGLGPTGSTGDPNAQGFDFFFGYNCQAEAHTYFPRYLWRNDNHIEINPRKIPGHAKQAEGEVKAETWRGENYAPDLMVAEAKKFIATHHEKPFFLYLPFIEPHVAMQPSQKSIDEYPENWDSKPYRGNAGYLPHPRPRAAYAAIISDLDRHVGAVRDALEKAGVLDETLIIFTSDNGTTHPRGKASGFHIGGVDAKFFNSTASLRGYKGSVYEGGLRVPMIVRLPGTVPQGSVNDTPSYFADWFPTLCAAFELKTPDGLDGENIWPVIQNTSILKNRKPMVWTFPEYGGQVAVRDGDMKILRRELKTPSPTPWEVYDIANDPSESKNLAAAHPELIEQTVTLLKKEMSPNPIFPLKLPDLNQL